VGNKAVGFTGISTNVGKELGGEVGIDDTVGDIDGSSDGVAVGASVGVEDGDSVAIVGRALAMSDGAWVGSSVKITCDRQMSESAKLSEQSPSQLSGPEKHPPDVAASSMNSLNGLVPHSDDISAPSTKLLLATEFSPPVPMKPTKELLFPRKQACVTRNSPPLIATMPA
jgi:hypothetical protein